MLVGPTAVYWSHGGFRDHNSTHYMIVIYFRKHPKTLREFELQKNTGATSSLIMQNISAKLKKLKIKKKYKYNLHFFLIFNFLLKYLALLSNGANFCN